MKLNKIEKIVVIVILLGLILGGGFFLFVMPSYKKIDAAQKKLDSNLQEQAQLNERLSRLDTIDGDIDQQKKDALKYEGTFYPDLTTFETSEIAMAYMKKCGLEAHAISVTPLTARDLTLEYSSPVEIKYDLKTYGRSAKESENAGDEAELTGTFEENGKKYSIVINNLSSVQILKEDGTPVTSYTENMQKVYKAAVCRYAQTNGLSQTVAVTQARYEVTGKFADYMKFIDYVYSLPRATSFISVNIPMTVELKKDNKKGDQDDSSTYIGEDGYAYSAEEAKAMVVPVTNDTQITKELTLTFFSVEPMNSMHSVDADGTEVIVDQRSKVY